jgi:hypothetical protein
MDFVWNKFSLMRKDYSIYMRGSLPNDRPIVKNISTFTFIFYASTLLALAVQHISRRVLLVF